MEYTKKEERCGCRINQAYNEKPFISYCPLHKSAPDLYEACKALLKWAELSYSNDTGEWADKSDPSILQVKEAIAKVEEVK